MAPPIRRGSSITKLAPGRPSTRKRARWVGLPPELGAIHVVDTASIGILGYEHNREEPVIRAWNLTS